MEHARELAVVLLVPLAVLAVVDGLWIHLWRLRLHTRPECAREHRPHTTRALLLPALLVLVCGRESTGILLALAFAAKPAAAWSLGASDPPGPIPSWQSKLVFRGLLPGAVAVAALHVVLALRFPRVDSERFAS